MEVVWRLMRVVPLCRLWSRGFDKARTGWFSAACVLRCPLFVALLAPWLHAAADHHLTVILGNLPPMEYPDASGTPTGFAVDVIQEAARREHIRLTWVRGGGMDQNSAMLRSGAADMVMSGSLTPERLREFYVSDAWWTDTILLVVPADSSIRAESDLRERKVGVSQTTISGVRDRYPGAQLVRKSTTVEAVTAVCRGELDAALVHAATLREIVSQPAEFCGRQLRVMDTPETRDYVLVGRREVAGQVRALRARIDELAEDGSLVTIAKRHPMISMVQATRQTEATRASHQRLFDRVMVAVVVGALVISLAFLIWQRSVAVKLRALNMRYGEARAEGERQLALLETSFDTLGEGVLIYDLEGRILYQNRASRAMHDYLCPDEPNPESFGQVVSATELVTTEGKPVPREDRPAFRVLRGEALREAAFCSRGLASGRMLRVLMSGSLARGRDGNPLAAVISVRDVTEKHRAEQQLQRQTDLLRAVCDHASDLIYVKDREGRYLLANPAKLRRLGRRDEEVMGHTAVEFQGDTSQALADYEQRLMETGEVATIEEFSTEEPTVYLTTRSPWFDASGNVVGLIGISRDITRRKEDEERARQWQRGFEQAELPIALTDHRTNRLREVNEAFCRMLGYTSAEIAGRPVSDVYVAEELGRLRSALQTIEECNHVLFETRLRRKDGSEVPVLVDLTLVRDADGEPAWRVVFVRDLTEVRAAEEQVRLYRERMEMAQQAAGFGVFECDLRTEAVVWSSEMRRIYGLREGATPPDLAAWAEMLPMDDRPQLLLHCRGQSEKGHMVSRFRLCRADTGEMRWMELYSRTAAGEDGKPARANGICLDVTDRQRAEEEILRLNADLEDRVRQRTAQLEASNRELESFAYSVSHDLRAPLRSIDGWSMALLEDYGDQMDATANAYLGRVRAEAQRMGVLIDDLLKLSRLTRAQMVVSPVDLSELAETVVDRIRPTLGERRVAFHIEPDIRVRGDRALLEIVLTNLMENAVKFTGKRAEADVVFGCKRVDGELAYFVRDNGAGFDMAHSSVLFGVFQRLHRQSEFPGTGVGLATVQRIIHRHGGRVWADSSPGKGAVFYFTIGDSHES